ncbi:hypothetical protein L1987_46438 [Smallanthus sonchifolius]|uniref:Uncharacterized protein n=1 Tax=Smallanthus sonchifolius TaxID=185202 RepID=A0ACB9G0T8_9ASTR|nr:hypothetical protein L1987_46438 [Smallanthus sonchifolius]
MISSVACGGGGSAYLIAGAQRALLAGLADELKAIPALTTRRSVRVCRVRGGDGCLRVIMVEEVAQVVRSGGGEVR